MAQCWALTAVSAGPTSQWVALPVTQSSQHSLGSMASKSLHRGGQSFLHGRGFPPSHQSQCFGLPGPLRLGLGYLCHSTHQRG